MKKNYVALISVAISLTYATSILGAEGVVKDGRTLVPVRGVFESLGFSVNWDSETNKASISDRVHEVSVIKGLNYFKADGKEIYPDVPQQIINGSLYLPLRAIGDAVGAETSWDDNTKTAHIKYNNNDVYINCQQQNVTSTSSNKTTIASSQTGIILKAGSVDYIMIPLDIFQSFGFAPAGEGIVQDDTYTIKSHPDHYDWFKVETNSGSGTGTSTQELGAILRYSPSENSEIIYVELEQVCNGIHASYSYDKKTETAHINYKAKDIYIKCYPKLDINSNYPNTTFPALNAIPCSITGTSYFYIFNNYQSLISGLESYIDELAEKGFLVSEYETSDTNMRITFTKDGETFYKAGGGISISVNIYNDYCTVHLGIIGS